MERSEDQDLSKKAIFGKKASEVKTKEPPSICPLLSIAARMTNPGVNCEKEKCWFYNRHLKVCAVVHVGMCLNMIATEKRQKMLRDLARK